MEIEEVEIGEDSFGGKLSCKRIGERGLIARTGIKEVMCSKDIVREESIRDEKGEKDVTMGEERIGIEGTESDPGIMSEHREGDGEIEMITESTKIGEERGGKTGSEEEVKGKDARRTGEDCGRDSVGSSAWPWLSSGMFTTSSLLACGDIELFFNLIFRLSFLMERLSLRRSDRCCTRMG